MQFGPIGAILITGVAFPLFHGHFYQSDPVVLSQLIAFILQLWFGDGLLTELGL